MTSFKSSFCIQYSSAGEIRRNSNVDGVLEDYTRYFINRHFHLNPAFSLLNEKQEKLFNSGNDVTVVSICENKTFVLEH